MAITFGKVGFRKYLEAQPPGSIVGETGRVTSCPLAQYGKAQGARATYVNNSSIDIYSDRDLYQLPTLSWHRRFINRVDSIDPSRVIGISVTREQALAALDAAEGATR